MKLRAACADSTVTVTLEPQTEIAASVLCLSFIGGVDVVSGGHQSRKVGGYVEVELGRLFAGQPHEVIFEYEEHLREAPKNRAWLPISAYLRSGQAIIPCELEHLGVDLNRADARPKPNPPKQDHLWLLPQPKEWSPDGGYLHVRGLNLPSDTFGAAADLLETYTDKSDPRGITPVIERVTGLDGYEVEISQTGLCIRATDEAGFYYAGVTLVNLCLTYGGRLPTGCIKDEAKYVWRGQHLDCARHFYSVETICHLLDLMAMLKLNRFHWHFADDEAFRLSLEQLPELSALTYRGEGQVIPAVFGGLACTGGQYSKSDVAHIVAYAQARFIEVMPEIEIPAHSLGLGQLFPSTSDPDDTGAEVSVQSYQKNTLNPACPETWLLWEKMIEGVSELFPFGVLHLGCDELPPRAWEGSPMIDDLKTKHDLKDAHDVLGWTMFNVAEIATRNGMRPAAWEEAQYGKNGGIGNNAILFSWTGQAAGRKAAELGYDIVMCPAQNTYFDMAHSTNSEDWGASWAACFGLDETVEWDPELGGNAVMRERVIGVQGAYWSEFTTDDQHMKPMIAPRIFGLASIAWSGGGAINTKDLRALAHVYSPVLEALNWPYTPWA